ncbi:FkbM family methyltransferase [uncultured Microscilla sp.]|uniref:FkbM family methyltransferase n=1 Tax=uncultured Microscilla sp. TaxID=432653 RepID=UPI00261DD026|nr:FkbM family methyltransferase [uncultured Microscilla sp.]
MLKQVLEKYRYYKTKRQLPKNDIKLIIKKYLGNSPNILEAGAHVGFDTAQFAMLFPKGKIYAFEPVPEIYNALEKNTSEFSNVFRYQQALSDKNGYMSINVSKGGVNGASSLLKPKKHTDLFPEITFNETVKVATVCLDNWAKQESIQKIDFMWLDMQGYEITALKEGENILKTTKMVFTEVNLEELYEGCPLKTEVIEYMKTQGFEVMKEFFEESEAYGDILFRKK